MVGSSEKKKENKKPAMEGIDGVDGVFLAPFLFATFAQHVFAMSYTEWKYGPLDHLGDWVQQSTIGESSTPPF